MLTPAIKAEIHQALWGSIELALFLKRGATRFPSSVAAFKRSWLVLFLIVPIVAIFIPDSSIPQEKSFLWVLSEQLAQNAMSTSVFLCAMYFFKPHKVTNDHFLQFATAYNWLSLPYLISQFPLILMGITGWHTWDDVYAMMLLMSLYGYSFLAYTISRMLHVEWFVAVIYAILCVMVEVISRNVILFIFINYF